MPPIVRIALYAGRIRTAAKPKSSIVAPGIHLVDINGGVWRVRPQQAGEVPDGFGLRADQDDAVRRHVPVKSCTWPQIERRSDAGGHSSASTFVE